MPAVKSMTSDEHWKIIYREIHVIFDVLSRRRRQRRKRKTSDEEPCRIRNTKRTTQIKRFDLQGCRWLLSSSLIILNAWARSFSLLLRHSLQMQILHLNVERKLKLFHHSYRRKMLLTHTGESRGRNWQESEEFSPNNWNRCINTHPIQMHMFSFGLTHPSQQRREPSKSFTWAIPSFDDPIGQFSRTVSGLNTSKSVSMR